MKDFKWSFIKTEKDNSIKEDKQPDLYVTCRCCGRNLYPGVGAIEKCNRCREK